MCIRDRRKLYADSRQALLLVFQALDAGGKDSTIRSVFRRVDPAGCRVYSYKAPNSHELQHDFLWRTAVNLPRKGMIAVFNRSHYEEVLAVRVHPEFLDAQHIADRRPPDAFWAQRYESIRDHERHLARNGTVILKFWLNVSAEAQRQRLLARLEDPAKHWKFERSDMIARERRAEYLEAYETALRETSREEAPWYAIPADDKPYMRMTVAQIVVDTLESMGLEFPPPDSAVEGSLDALTRALRDGG